MSVKIGKSNPHNSKVTRVFTKRIKMFQKVCGASLANKGRYKAGEVVLQFSLDASGKAQSMKTLKYTTSHAMAHCVSNRMKKASFPKMDKPTTFKQTILFK